MRPRTALGLGAVALLGLWIWKSQLFVVSRPGDRPRPLTAIAESARRPVALDVALPAVPIGMVRLTSGEGVVLVHYWAPWERDGRRQAQDLDSLRKVPELAGLSAALVCFDPFPSVARFVGRNRIGVRVLLDGRRELQRTLPCPSLPWTYVIDRRGRIAVSQAGEVDWAGSSTRRTLRRMLEEGAEPDSLGEALHRTLRIGFGGPATGRRRDGILESTRPKRDARVLTRAIGALHRATPTLPTQRRPTVTDSTREVAEDLALLYEAATTFGRTLDPDRVFHALRDLVAGAMPCDGVLVSSYHPDDRMIRCEHAWVEGSYVEPEKFPPVRLNPEGKGMQSRVISTGEPLLIHDVEQYLRDPNARYYFVDPDGTTHDAPTEDEHSHSAMMVPITLDGQVLGVVQVMSNRRAAYSERDLHVFQTLAAHMGQARKNAHLYQQAQAEIAHRRTMEQALRASEARSRELAETRERHVLERTAELEESHRQMDGFTYSVSHDLQAPVRAIRGYTDALLDELGDTLGPLGREYAVRIAEATNRMDRLIRDLLEYGRLGKVELAHAPLTLRECVEEAIGLAGTEFAHRHVHVELQVPADAPAVVGHRPTVVQVVWNLLSNAVKFVAPGTIPRVRLWVEARETHVRLWVEDNGIGIAPEHHQVVFGVFQRLHPEHIYAGTGIGLAIVRRAVERMGGRAEVESDGVHGSRFWIELPRSAPLAAEPAGDNALHEDTAQA